MANASAVEAAIIAADDARLKAMTGADYAKLDALIQEPFIYTHGSGREDDKAGWLGPQKSGSVRYSDAERSDTVVHSHGDTAWLHGRLKIKVTRDGGAPNQLESRFTSVWIKEGGEWKIAVYHATSIRP